MVDVDAELQRADALAREGRALEAIDVLTETYHANADARVALRLVEVRNQAFDELPRDPGRPVWPATFADPLLRDGLVRNHMVRMLSLTVDEMTDGALTRVTVDDARVRRAQENLESRIDVMGIQEEFDAFCAELTTRFGWDLGQAHVANRTEPAPASAELCARIAADNAADAELYAFAVDLWHRRAGARSRA